MGVKKKATAVLLSTFLLLSVSVSSTTTAVDTALSESTFKYHDDFSGYENGSGGNPNWITDITWEINSGFFINFSDKKSFAKLNSPIGANLHIESEVIVEKPLSTGDKYRTSGIAVYLDDGNYWRLALVEAPDGKDNTHFVELAEAYQGKWGAQEIDKTELEVKGEFGDRDFRWEYGTPYLLRIILDEISITGAVYDLDGNLKWKKVYLFTSDNCVEKGTPSLVTAGLNTKFDNINVSIKNSTANIDTSKSKAFTQAQLIESRLYFFIGILFIFGIVFSLFYSHKKRSKNDNRF